MKTELAKLKESKPDMYVLIVLDLPTIADVSLLGPTRSASSLLPRPGRRLLTIPRTRNNLNTRTWDSFELLLPV
jgi:hypothetical protein